MKAMVDHHMSITLEDDDAPFEIKSDRFDGAIMRVHMLHGSCRDEGRVTRVTLRGPWYKANGELTFLQTDKYGVPITDLPAYIQLKITELFA